MATNIVLKDGDAAGNGGADTPLERLRDALAAVQQRLANGEFDPADAKYGTLTPPMRRNFGAVAMNNAPATPN